MKNLWISVKITLAMPVARRGICTRAARGFRRGPQRRQAAETLRSMAGSSAPRQRRPAVHRRALFLGRPRPWITTAAARAAATALRPIPNTWPMEQRVQDFLAAHPYLSARGASENGDSQRFGPRSRHLAPRAQVRRVAAARGLDEAVVQRLVDSLTQKPWLGAFSARRRSTSAPEYRAGNPATERHGLGRCPAGRRVRGDVSPEN